MNNKIKLIISTILIIFLQAMITLPIFADGDTPGEYRSLGVGLFMNVKYLYQSWYLDFQSRRFLFNDKVRLNFKYEGFRITKYAIGEVNRFQIEADYILPLKSGLNFRHFLLPKAGLFIFYDLYGGSEPMKGFSAIPNIGVDYVFNVNRHTFTAENTFSFYSDGLWYELGIRYGIDIFKFLALNIKLNTIVALTYNGKISAGLYPYAYISFIFGRE